ncbi:hypothetical protein SLE2022_360100 [Rubroshorea leprosula]
MPPTAGETPAEDGGSASVSQRIIKIGKTSDDSDKKAPNNRLKDVEICVPIVCGTITFYLGRKASEQLSMIDGMTQPLKPVSSYEYT